MRFVILLIIVVFLTGCNSGFIKNQEGDIFIKNPEQVEQDSTYQDINQRAGIQGIIDADQGLNETDYSNEIFAEVQYVDTGICSYNCGYLLYRFNYSTGEPTNIGFKVRIGTDTVVTPQSNIVQLTCSMDGMYVEIIEDSISLYKSTDKYMSGKATHIIDLPNCDS